MPSWKATTGQASQQDYRRARAHARSQRRNPTASENLLWRELRQMNREGAGFRRQLPFGPWVFDFGYLSARLLIEVDGGVHEAFEEVAVRDAQKASWAKSNGFQLLRFSNHDVWERIDVVIERIRASIADLHPLHPPLHKGEGE